jgi:hypothetical protein
MRYILYFLKGVNILISTFCACAEGSFFSVLSMSYFYSMKTLPDFKNVFCNPFQNV